MLKNVPDEWKGTLCLGTQDTQVAHAQHSLMLTQALHQQNHILYGYFYLQHLVTLHKISKCAP